MTSEEELDRVRVIGDDGAWLTAIEVRLVVVIDTPRGPRRHIGARSWRLDTGHALAIVDRTTFLVISTGEFLRLAEPTIGDMV